MKNIGKPCAGKLPARFGGEGSPWLLSTLSFVPFDEHRREAVFYRNKMMFYGTCGAIKIAPYLLLAKRVESIDTILHQCRKTRLPIIDAL